MIVDELGMRVEKVDLRGADIREAIFAKGGIKSREGGQQQKERM